MQIYTLEQEKRGLCPYDDKRYLLANLPNGLQNPDTHAYGHYLLAAEEQLVTDMPEQAGSNMVIEQRQPRHDTNQVDEPYYTTLEVVKRELRFKRNHERVVKTDAKRIRRDSTGEEIEGDEYEQVPEGDENGELKDAQLHQAERATANRPGAAIRIGDAIERICACENLQLPDSPHKRMPPPSPQQAGKSYNGLMPKLLHNSVRNLFAGPSRANLPFSGIGPRRIVYSSDEEDDAPPRPPPFGYRPQKID